jgi:hypothetical protein
MSNIDLNDVLQTIENDDRGVFSTSNRTDSIIHMNEKGLRGGLKCDQCGRPTIKPLCHRCVAGDDYPDEDEL